MSPREVDSEGNEIPQDETVEETTEETTEEIVTEGDHEVADLWLDRNYELEVSEALVEVGSSAYQAVQDWIFYREVSTDWLYGG